MTTRESCLRAASRTFRVPVAVLSWLSRRLDRLGDTDESGTHTTYFADYRRQGMQEAIRLRDSGHTVEELMDRLA